MSAISWSGFEWVLRPAPAEPHPGLHPVAARCLRVPPARREAWLSPGLDALHDPYLMRGMERAVERLRRAARDGERVRIASDYDVDGTTSALILEAALRLAGVEPARLDTRVPHRMEDGYGLGLRAVRRAIEAGVRVLVTADVGVREHEAVAAAAEAGIDVIVVDHHLPAGADVPPAAHAVLCPPQPACDYPNPHLAACGVSLKVAQALLERHPRREALLRSFLKLAAIGTVADVVSLGTLENRAIVALGLAEMGRGRNAPGLAALVEVAGLAGRRPTAEDVGFRIAPRINAAGRLASADLVLELLRERDPARAREAARRLDALNRKRQEAQRRLEALCAERAEGEASAFPVFWGPEDAGWHRGIVGIVAARLRERLDRPVAVAAVVDGAAHGSVRSVPGLDAVAALDAAADLLDRHGGHPGAAGFRLPAEHLPELARRLDAWARTAAAGERTTPVLEADAPCGADDIDLRLARDLARLGPFGKGNPEPLLLVSGARLRGVAPMRGGHLRARLGRADLVWWRGAPHRDRLDRPIDLLVRVQPDVFLGVERVRVVVEDARDAAGG